MAQNLNAFAMGYAEPIQVGQMRAQQTAGNALANGDATGAANALFQSGDIQGGQQIQTAQRQQQAQATQTLVRGVSGLMANGADPQTAFAAAMKYAPALGLNPADLMKVKPAFDQDPQGFLQFANAQAAKELQFFQTDSGIYTGDKGTGKVTLAQALPGKPIALDPDKSYIQANVPGAPNANVPMPAAGQPQATAPTQQANAPRGVRNNNPLNLSNLGGGQTWNGQTGTDGQYAVFATPQAGMAAADRNLQTYATKYGLNTLAGVIGRWAPPGSNDTQSYVATVAKDLGVDPNQPLNLADAGVRQRVLQSMAKVELGQPAPAATLQGGSDGDQIAQQDQQAPPGYHFIQRAQADSGKGGKWEVYTDPKTNTQFRYNAATHEATTLDGSPYTPGALQKLAGGGGPRSAVGLALQRFLAQHPDATDEDVAQFNARFNMEKAATTAFGTGKQGQTINSLNVSIDHLSTLSNLAAALGNGDLQLLNRVSQTWQAQTGNPAPANFEAAKQIVADEIVKGIVGAGGTGGDRDKAQRAINNASSPQQLAGVIGTYKQLLAGQLNGLRLQYKNTTGRGDFEDKLLPETRAALEGTTGPAAPQGNGPPGSTWSRMTPAQRQTAAQFRTASAKVGQPGNPYVPTTQAEFDGLPVGASFINPADGQVMRKTH